MPNIPTPRESPAHIVPVEPAPPSVRFAQRLLWLQASIWAIGAVGGGIVLGYWALIIPAVGWSAFAGGMAAVKALLARRLPRGRSQRVRKAVITVELAMTGFGVVWFSTPYSAPVAELAGFVGACLSLAAALLLMRPPARQHAQSDPGENPPPPPAASRGMTCCIAPA